MQLPLQYDWNGRRVNKKNKIKQNPQKKSSAQNSNPLQIPETKSECELQVDKVINDYLSKNNPEEYKNKENVHKMKINNYIVTDNLVISITINEIESFNKTGLHSIGFFIHFGDNFNKNIDDKYRLNINLSKICNSINLNDTLDNIIKKMDNKMINNAVTVENRDGIIKDIRQYGLEWLRANNYLVNRHDFVMETLERVGERTTLQGLLRKDDNNIAAKIGLLKLDLERDSVTGDNKEESKQKLTLVNSLEKENYNNEKNAKKDSLFVNQAKLSIESMAKDHYETHYKNKPVGGMRRRTRRRMTTKRKRRNTRHKTIRKRRNARR